MTETTSKAKPLEVFRLSRGPLTSTQLVMYAGASGDFNRIHFDHLFAVEAGLGGVLAHGMLTMGFAASCLTAMLGEQHQVREIGARFLAPVHVGDTVDTTCTLREIMPDGSCAIDMESCVGSTVVLRGRAIAQ